MTTTSPAGRARRPESAPLSAAETALLDAGEAARSVGLRYVTDARPGVRRRRSGAGFTYTSPTGERITDPDRLRWFRSLAVPPAWTDVWISPVQNGHILATGRDARGRKQYRYHPRWREVRDETKYTRMIAFGELLPKIRKRVDADLARNGLPREKVLAAVIRLLEMTFIRVGNEEYARLNKSFGLTTLRNRHVTVEGTRVRFKFRGKSGRDHEVGIRDRRLAGVIRRMQDLPGQELFQYVDHDGEVQSVSSDDVNRYLREISGEEITAKDFRTWAGTVLAFRALRSLDKTASQTEAKHNVVSAIRDVASRLGNTPAVCRRSYVHPAVVDAYMEGSLHGARPEAEARSKGAETTAGFDSEANGTDPDEEAAVLDLLRRRLQEAEPAKPAAETPAA